MYQSNDLKRIFDAAQESLDTTLNYWATMQKHWISESQLYRARAILRKDPDLAKRVQQRKIAFSKAFDQVQGKAPRTPNAPDPGRRIAHYTPQMPERRMLTLMLNGRLRVSPGDLKGFFARAHHAINKADTGE